MKKMYNKGYCNTQMPNWRQYQHVTIKNNNTNNKVHSMATTAAAAATTGAATAFIVKQFVQNVANLYAMFLVFNQSGPCFY